MKSIVLAAFIVVLSAGLGVGVAQADVRLVYETADGEFTMEYRDPDNIRFRLPDNAFLLITGGQGYALHRGQDGWTAVSAEQVRSMARAAGGSEQVRLIATGEHETVAGIRGERYRVQVGDDWADSWRDDGSVVLSDNAQVRVSGRAMQRLVGVFGLVDDSASFGGASGVDLERFGLLASDDMRLGAVSTDRLPDHTFQLPPGVQHRELPSGSAGAASSGEPGWLAREMEGVRDEARGEVERETRREVRDGVRDSVRGLFGR